MKERTRTKWKEELKGKMKEGYYLVRRSREKIQLLYNQL